MWAERVAQCAGPWWARVVAAVRIPRGVRGGPARAGRVRSSHRPAHPLGLTREPEQGWHGRPGLTEVTGAAGLGEQVLGACVCVSHPGAECEASGACGSPGMSRGGWRDRPLFEALVQMVHQRQAGNSPRHLEDAAPSWLSPKRRLSGWRLRRVEPGQRAFLVHPPSFPLTVGGCLVSG